MKARDMTSVYVLRGVSAAAKNVKVERRVAELSEAELVDIIRREIRKRHEAEQFAAQAGREDLVRQNVDERAVLEPYVPAMLSSVDLEAWVRAFVDTHPAVALGQVMAGLKAEYAGRFDGREASALVRRVLGERDAR